MNIRNVVATLSVLSLCGCMSMIDHAMDRMDASMKETMKQAQLRPDPVNAMDCVEVTADKIENTCRKEIKLNLQTNDACSLISLLVPGVIPAEVTLGHADVLALNPKKDKDLKDYADLCSFGKGVTISQADYVK